MVCALAMPGGHCLQCASGVHCQGTGVKVAKADLAAVGNAGEAAAWLSIASAAVGAIDARLVKYHGKCCR